MVAWLLIDVAGVNQRPERQIASGPETGFGSKRPAAILSPLCRTSHSGAFRPMCGLHGDAGTLGGNDTG